MENRAEREAACAEMGVSIARFLRGRLERGSAEVGTDSGIFSDILADLRLAVFTLSLSSAMVWVEYSNVSVASSRHGFH